MVSFCTSRDWFEVHQGSKQYLLAFIIDSYTIAKVDIGSSSRMSEAWLKSQTSFIIANLD